MFNAAATPLFSNDDNNGDPGDIPGVVIGGAFNSRIETGVLPAGNYVAAVAAFPSSASQGGNVENPVPATGVYTMHVSVNANAVPEPATLVLFGAGLVGLAAYGRRRRR